MQDKSSIDKHLLQRVREDMLDNLDEEYELEMDDQLDDEGQASLQDRQQRLQYFKNLLRLQGESVSYTHLTLPTKRIV